jgi:hypothetical protein
MNDGELNREIAEAMGWRCHETAVWGWYYNRGEGDYPFGTWKPLSDFVNDLNALRDHPEKRLRLAGWQSFHSQVDGVYHYGWRRGAEVFAADSEDEGEARALACLPALKALEETGAVMQGGSE